MKQAHTISEEDDMLARRLVPEDRVRMWRRRYDTKT